MLELHAATQPGIHARAGPPYRVLMEAAAADPELAGVWDQLEAQRLDGMRRLAQLLWGRGAAGRPPAWARTRPLEWGLRPPRMGG